MNKRRNLRLPTMSTSSMQKSFAGFRSALIAAAALCGTNAVMAAAPEYGVPSPASAAPFEGVWLIDLKASGLPGYGKNPPQLTEWAANEQKQRKEKRAKGDVYFDLTAFCSNPGMPRVMSLPSPIEIYVRQREVTLLMEWNQLFRQIFVDGGKYEALQNTAAGVSIGKWDHGKLLVDTTDRNDKTMLDDSIPNSEDLTTKEVFEVSKDGQTLKYQVTITDPKALAAPWTRNYLFRKQKNRALVEDRCVDRYDAKQKTVPAGF